MEFWTISHIDEQGLEQEIGFSHSPEGATDLAESFLLDRDAALSLPWHRVLNGLWSMSAEPLDDDAPYVTLYLRHLPA